MKLIEIDLNKQILGLDGQPMTNADSLGKLLAGRLAFTSKGPHLKFYDWAMTLYKGDVLKIDKSDFGELKQFITTDEGLVNLTKVQILNAIEQVETKE